MHVYILFILFIATISFLKFVFKIYMSQLMELYILNWMGFGPIFCLISILNANCYLRAVPLSIARNKMILFKKKFGIV